MTTEKQVEGMFSKKQCMREIERLNDEIFAIEKKEEEISCNADLWKELKWGTTKRELTMTIINAKKIELSAFTQLINED